MALDTSIIPYTLDFKFPAGTSRGVLNDKTVYFIKIYDDANKNVHGFGECGPLAKLSIDDKENLEEIITYKLRGLKGTTMPQSIDDIYSTAFRIAGDELPALRFAIETALLDLKNGGVRKIFNSSFYNDAERIPINGLIWMGHMEAMLLQISDKVDAGYDCIKMKVGSLDFEKEVDILQYIRRKYYDRQIVLRVDANGAFKPEEALYKLNAMAQYDIHSIEQPIKPGQPKLMGELCRKSPIPIALDEELIGVKSEEKKPLLEAIRPQFIILKPTLLGGFESTIEWIKTAESMDIGWWLTSALESNIGLNAICQFTHYIKARGHQGLGTGSLYHNNIESPLAIMDGHIFYDQSRTWNVSAIDS